MKKENVLMLKAYSAQDVDSNGTRMDVSLSPYRQLCPKLDSNSNTAGNSSR